jgi:hypothetical protein
MTEPDETQADLAATFADWEDVEGANLLRLPIKGKTYTIPALGHLDGIKIRMDFVMVAKGQRPQMDSEKFLRTMLGPVLDEMRADNVPDKAIVHAAATAHADTFLGRAEALKTWREGISPEALAAAVDLAAAASSTTSPATPRPARSSSTKKPASSASTRSPRTKAARSTGTKSSRSRG